MDTTDRRVRDYRGIVMFTCSDCGNALTDDDFFHLGMRLPDPGESRDDYCESELLDTVGHASCLRARRAG